MSQKTIRTLRIENFQSHELTEMAFDDGLNVIVGASDHGKSAVIRALRWLLFNEPRGSDFIRVGASQCRVSIELVDGSRVTRERTPSKNRYIVVDASGEEQIYEGFGNSVPKEVSDITGVAKIMLDEDTETVLHLGTQLEPPFLLSETGSIKAKAIGRLNGVHIIDAASRDTSRDLTRLNSEEKQYREQLAEVEQELLQFSDLAYMENILIMLEERQARLKQLGARLENLRRLREQHTRIRGELSSTVHVLEQTQHIERAALRLEQAGAVQSKALRLNQTRNKWTQVRQALTETDHILRVTEQLPQAHVQVERQEQRLAAYRRLSKLAADRESTAMQKSRVDAVLDRTAQLVEAEQRVGRIEQSGQRLTRLRDMSRKHGETGQVLSKIDIVLRRTAQVADAEVRVERLAATRTKSLLLHELLGKKREIDRQMHALTHILERLQKTQHVEFKVEELAMLSDRQKRLHEWQAQIVDVIDRLHKADAYLANNEHELRDMIEQYTAALKESGSCPVCFTPIDEHTTERLVEEFRGGVSE
ncbi:AAA family ATPase [Tumebacillus permanentifrigoris]|uniref:Nuclease SbcCD subunit C n=1 Tax=Tumebacillus permanentifrigoris TaxID=378543 RepID=A0A316D9U2_9BACL|nr:AAA family ATPase [Tumebacillus permanentifrigoris]PWK13938.1 exonuclease SbcC [Tumebacillus permanentifrigoris]